MRLLVLVCLWVGLVVGPAAAQDAKVKAVRSAAFTLVAGQECAASRNDPNQLEFAKAKAREDLLGGGYSEPEADEAITAMLSRPTKNTPQLAKMSCSILDKRRP